MDISKILETGAIVYGDNEVIITINDKHLNVWFFYKARDWELMPGGWDRDKDLSKTTMKEAIAEAQIAHSYFAGNR